MFSYVAWTSTNGLRWRIQVYFRFREIHGDNADERAFDSICRHSLLQILSYVADEYTNMSVQGVSYKANQAIFS